MLGEKRPMDFAFARYLNMSVQLGEPGHAAAHVEATDAHLNPYGIVHGGAVSALIDTAMGAAVAPMLPEGARCATIEMQVRFLRPAGTGTLTGEARVIKPGRSVFHAECTVTDAAQRTVAVGTATFAVVA